MVKLVFITIYLYTSKDRPVDHDILRSTKDAGDLRFLWSLDICEIWRLPCHRL